MVSIWPALSDIALHHGRRVSARDLQTQSARIHPDASVAVAAYALQGHGFHIQMSHAPAHQLPTGQLPMLVLLKGGEVVVWQSMRGEALVFRRYGVLAQGVSQAVEALEDAQAVQENWSWADFLERYAGTALLVEPDKLHDAQNAGDAGRQQSHWFWGVFGLLRRYYGDCVVAAVLINLLALAGSMFSMNVYDRVIPNAALPTLWVLAIGVTVASLLEFGLRTLRAHVVDEAGKRADLLLSAAIFRKTLDLQPRDRPASSGQYAGQVREFDSVREFVSSTTLVGLTDLPFAIVFLVVIGFLAGSLVWVPIVAGLLVLLVGLLSQWPISKSVERYQYENSQKLAFMVEAVERVETIQAIGAQAAIQGRWERLCAVTARSAMSSRMASSAAVNLTQFIQQFAATALVLWGVHLILEGHLTTGGLIGCSILAGRALSPLAQVAGLMTRWQQTKIAYGALDRVMQLPSRYDATRTYVQLQQASGALQLKEAEFSYPRSEQKTLKIQSLTFQPGETVAIMGPVGSGKSTLLKLLAGLHPPGKGQLLLDGVDVTQISPADFRAQVAWVSQDPVLFRGSLRENLLIAAPQIPEERLLQVLRLTGVQQLANQHPQGLDMPLGENGQALSGGQRQMVALARALLSPARLVLLDEPTSAFDEASEQQLLRALRAELDGRTMIVVTHRPAPLGLVKRLVILESGQVVADGPRDAVLQAVRDGQVARARAFTEAAATADQAASPKLVRLSAPGTDTVAA
jgi:ATP-binding cassette subfamily C protein LapB